MLDVGIMIDSSVVPGAALLDNVKGFDFRGAPDEECWRFDKSPVVPDANGRFLELPVTPHRLGLFYYWNRLVARASGIGRPRIFGDGMSKPIGRFEIIRRLTGGSRWAELSADEPKSMRLKSELLSRKRRRLWHVMGHPKLLSVDSLRRLTEFVDEMDFERKEPLTTIAREFLSGGLRC